MHASSPRAILFDFDGTLLDSFDDIVDAANATLEAVGRAALPPAQVRSFIGDGLPSLVAQCLDATGGGGDDPARVERFTDQFKPHYAAHWLDRSGLYAGVEELLSVLREHHIPLALVSNKPEAACHGLVAALSLEGRFDVVAGGDTYPERKPEAGPVTRTLARLDVPPEDAVMVGDGTQDIRAGAAAGARTVGVTWGLNDAATLQAAGADAVVDTFEALAEALGVQLS